MFVWFIKVTMVYQLFEKSYIHSLDDPLVKYAPDFKINNPFSKLVKQPRH